MGTLIFKDERTLYHKTSIKTMDPQKEYPSLLSLKNSSGKVIFKILKNRTHTMFY